jgi:hypothetical protein
MIHEGFLLKQYIAEGYVSANDIANDLGISKAAVYGLYGNEKLDKKYVDILVKKKHKIVGLTVNIGEGAGEVRGNSLPNQDNSLPKTHSDMMQLMRDTINALKGENEMQKKYIAVLEEKLKD